MAELVVVLLNRYRYMWVWVCVCSVERGERTRRFFFGTVKCSYAIELWEMEWNGCCAEEVGFLRVWMSGLISW